MSYSIIYEKQFIKVSETEVIPVILVGDNNLYEYGGARARDWYAKLVNGKRIVTLDDINQELEYQNNKYYNPKGEETSNNLEKDFGYLSGIAMYGKGTHKTTWNMYKNVYLKGFEQALTVEEISKKQLYINVNVGRKLGTPPQPTIDKLAKGGISTTKELLEHLQIVIEACVTVTGYSCYISLGGYDSERKVKALRREHFPVKKREKVPTTVDRYYAISIDAFGKLLKESRKGHIKTTYYNNDAKPFVTEKMAERALKRIEKRFSSNVNFKVIEINEERTILV